MTTSPSEKDRSKVDVVAHVFVNLLYPATHSAEAGCRGTSVRTEEERSVRFFFNCCKIR